jgi:hypothetical protein
MAGTGDEGRPSCHRHKARFSRLSVELFLRPVLVVIIHAHVGRVWECAMTGAALAANIRRNRCFTSLISIGKHDFDKSAHL